uniref:Uncharacterized protein n=1 Tax=Anguilla anguilla TaxID=7936 RepID=A0A0E9PK60_ANGAN
MNKSILLQYIGMSYYFLEDLGVTFTKTLSFETSPK